MLVFLSNCNLRSAETSRHAAAWRERAAQALVMAARYDRKRALDLRARAGHLYLQAGAPLRALLELRRARSLAPGKRLTGQYEVWRRQSEEAVRRADPAFERKLETLAMGTAGFENSYGVNLAPEMLPNCDPTFIDDLLVREPQMRFLNYRDNDPPPYLRRYGGATPPAELRQVVDRFPNSAMAPALLARAIWREHPRDPYGHLTGLEDALRRYPDHPGTGLLLGAFWRAAFEAGRRSGFSEYRLKLRDPYLRAVASLVANTGRASYLGKKKQYAEAARLLAGLENPRENRWLELLIDATLDRGYLSPSAIPFRAGYVYLRAKNPRLARAQFHRVLSDPDRYIGHNAARLGLAICDLQERKLPEAFAVTPQDLDLIEFSNLWSFYHEMDIEFSNLLSFYHEMDIDRLFSVDLKQEEVARFIGPATRPQVRSRAVMAFALRAQRAQRFREATWLQEAFVLQFPDNAYSRKVLVRLGTLERRPLPDADLLSGAARRLLPKEVAACRILRRLRRFTEQGRSRGDVTATDAVYGARHSPRSFRIRRVFQRTVHRLAWNCRMRTGYDAGLTRETATFDRAEWLSSDPGSRTICMDEEGCIHDFIAFYDWPELTRLNRVRSIQVSRTMNGHVIAAEELARFVRDYPNSKLVPQALLLAMRARKDWVDLLTRYRSRHPLVRKEVVRAREFARAEFRQLKKDHAQSPEARKAAGVWKELGEKMHLLPQQPTRSRA